MTGTQNISVRVADLQKINDIAVRENATATPALNEFIRVFNTENQFTEIVLPVFSSEPRRFVSLDPFSNLSLKQCAKRFNITRAMWLDHILRQDAMAGWPVMFDCVKTVARPEPENPSASWRGRVQVPVRQDFYNIINKMCSEREIKTGPVIAWLLSGMSSDPDFMANLIHKPNPLQPYRAVQFQDIWAKDLKAKARKNGLKIYELTDCLLEQAARPFIMNAIYDYAEHAGKTIHEPRNVSRET